MDQRITDGRRFSQEMIIKIRTALLNADPTVTSISIDGDSTSYSVEQAHKMLQEYEEEERRACGKPIRIRGFSVTGNSMR